MSDIISKSSQPPASVKTLEDFVRWRVAEDARMRAEIATHVFWRLVAEDPQAFSEAMDGLETYRLRFVRNLAEIEAEESIPVRSEDDYLREVRESLTNNPPDPPDVSSEP